MVDFRRIAILEPTLVFPRPISSISEKEIISYTRQWAEVALKNGADAWYIRFHADYEFIPTIQVALASFSEVTRLFPFPARHLAHPGDAVHFRNGDTTTKGLDELNHGFTFRGISCHDLDELHEAQLQAFDYAFYSPIFKTKSHPEADPLGIEALQKVCAEISISIFALGGVTAEHEKACLEAGAFGIAGIRMFME